MNFAQVSLDVIHRITDSISHSIVFTDCIALPTDVLFHCDTSTYYSFHFQKALCTSLVLKSGPSASPSLWPFHNTEIYNYFSFFLPYICNPSLPIPLLSPFFHYSSSPSFSSLAFDSSQYTIDFDFLRHCLRLIESTYCIITN